MNFIYSAVTFFLSLPIRAQIGEMIGEDAEELLNTTPTATGDAAVTDVVQKVLNIAIPVSILACIALLSYAGYIMITSQGNPEKLNEAKEVVTNALTGFAIILLSVVILLLIGDVLSLNL